MLTFFIYFQISKLLLHTSGRIISGSVTVVLGGVTMLYDIYKLSGEVTDMAKLGEEGASEIRTIADQLEEALLELCYNKSEEMRQKEERIQHLEDEGGDASALNTDENSAIGSETSLNAKKDPEQVEDSNSSCSDETEIGDVENTP